MVTRRVRIVGLALLAIVDNPGSCLAGMPSITLSEMARARIQSISFFLVCFLVCAWCVRRIWNALADDFPRLPRLSNGKAAGLVALWGLLFLLILTMISGARELMTPGAWRKQGLTYKLTNEAKVETDANADSLQEQVRRDRLEGLSMLLRHYATTHGGAFPADDRVPEIPAQSWQLPDPSGMRYLYAKGRNPGGPASPLAYEPGIFGKERLVLLTDGSIRKIGIQELETMLTQEPK